MKSKYALNKTVRQELIDGMVMALDNDKRYGHWFPKSETDWNGYVENFCQQHEYKSEMWPYYLGLTDRAYRSLVKTVIRRLDDLQEARKAVPSTMSSEPPRIGADVGEATQTAPQYTPEQKQPSTRQRVIVNLASLMFFSNGAHEFDTYAWCVNAFVFMDDDCWNYFMKASGQDTDIVIASAKKILAVLQEVL